MGTEVKPLLHKFIQTDRCQKAAKECLALLAKYNFTLEEASNVFYAAKGLIGDQPLSSLFPQESQLEDHS